MNQTSVNATPLSALVVDDNITSAKTTAWTIEFMGYDVKIAHNAADALRIAREFKPAVVILDITLPDMSGYELCQIMRKEPELSKAMYIAQTGWNTPEHFKMSAEAGFDHHLVKPVKMEVLESLLAPLSRAA